jgi:hypothetical protein
MVTPRTSCVPNSLLFFCPFVYKRSMGSFLTGHFVQKSLKSSVELSGGNLVAPTLYISQFYLQVSYSSIPATLHVSFCIKIHTNFYFYITSRAVKLELLTHGYISIPHSSCVSLSYELYPKSTVSCSTFIGDSGVFLQNFSVA